MFKKSLEYINIVLLSLTGVFLIALQIKPEGWYIWLAGLILLLFCEKKFKKDFSARS